MPEINQAQPISFGRAMKCVSHLIAGVVVGLLALAAAAVFAPAQAAGKSEIYHDFGSSLALSGYDPVAYFTLGKPVKGDAKIKATYKNSEWRFVSEANKAAFLAAPEKYAPQYGGYCAWAAARGFTAEGSPNYWKIVNGKLYLNNNKSIQDKWEKDIPGFIKKADENWPAVLK